MVKEVDGAGSEAYNVYGSKLISREVGGERAYFLYNGQGDVTALTDETGDVVARYYYDPFGNHTRTTQNGVMGSTETKYNTCKRIKGAYNQLGLGSGESQIATPHPGTTAYAKPIRW